MIQVAKKLSILLLSTVWITQASWAQTTLSFDSQTSGTVEPFDPLFDLPPLHKPRPFGLVPAFNSDGETVNPYGTGLFPGASGSLFAGIVEGVTLYEEESAALPTSLATLQANDINLDAALGGDDGLHLCYQLRQDWHPDAEPDDRGRDKSQDLQTGPSAWPRAGPRWPLG